MSGQSTLAAESLQGAVPLHRELNEARAGTDRLFRLIQPESLYIRPIPERHRLIFYLGHLEAFDWNLLARKSLGQEPFHDTFDKLFERGIDPEPGAAAQDIPGDWPTRREVETYNQATRQWLDSHLEDLDPSLVRMAIEHRHMHAETIAYLLHALDYSQKVNSANGDIVETGGGAAVSASLNLIDIPAGTAFLGASGRQFAWDNERLAHQLAVPEFRISRFKISNGEYLEFVREGGPAPHFWIQRSGKWFYRGMFQEIPLPLDWPVWVTWDQASAYSKWRGLALPSEAQFHRGASLSSPDPVRDNFGYQRWDPIPVDYGANSRQIPHQMVGNGWEWTQDTFGPFEGFEAHPFYPGYSADFFDGRHYVMKGASPRTAGMLTRPSFRNWFRPDYPHMYAGFRLVAS